MTARASGFQTRLMPIDAIPDWETRIARQDACWEREILDRPVVIMTVPKSPAECCPLAEHSYSSLRDRWLDTDRLVESAVATVRNTEYLGDALPLAWPNLGPEVFSAFFGCEMEFGETTTWAIPCIHDWAEAPTFRFSRENAYWRKLEEMTGALLDAGQGLFYTGLSDIHTGGDAIAAFRDPQQLNIDLLFHPQEVRELLAYVNRVFFEVLDSYFAKLTARCQPITSWPGIVSSKRWMVPSNDFSCMISKEMFDEFFLPGIREECRHLEASVYHLDGPAALRHLDSLLEIPELDMLQWVYGAGNGRASDWVPVYQRCQAAKKGIQLFIEPDELPVIIENLRPYGVWMGVSVPDRDAAEVVLKTVEKWR
ncbi:MAG TPA: hypothetical protein PLM14_00075 [Candidatus Hydrogenedentes bacterium]|nr:hypothetical protein [Candidatus Hydrogenedentota bacterium]HQE81358.1 hypothetical protein [Candidatus Hydrogenedentota bacterium]HQH50945.1 hypothetical protein [Candidatus Hydrogenedentota bacterium]HQM47043.1 hypothetical protein [Candidatus Hydrogenedentota bacterium]